ncbi:hypothetical protein LPJ59_001358 [Coemansia sp. RSA 2399]|nr:hypothetical protein LPJ59_001358 [Coemansia sp. RSA 2399]KAJ1906742.1 hypothetical protein LPJ81_001179 [Coemansia sp. IMI 209127]
MNDADDLQYDSVVSDPGAYDGILGSAASARHGTGAEDSNNMITPSTHRSDTPPPPQTPVPGGPSDSIPSLLEFDHERHDSSNLNGSQQSQYGMKSGMYTNGSKADFMTQLKGDVVVSGRWSTIGEPQVPRSALRGNRPYSQQPDDRGIGSSPGPLSPQTVSFAGLGPLTNSDASLHELKDEGSTMASGNSTAQESIVFRPQDLDTHQYGSAGEDDDGDDDGMSTQPLEDDNEDPDVEDPYQQDRDGSDYNQGSGKTRLSSAVSIGVGMAGGLFGKFPIWRQQHPQQRPPSALAGALPLLSQGRKGKQAELRDGSAGARQEEDAAADIDRTPRSTAGRNESTMETHASSLSTTSSLSSVQTEPMRSHLFSNQTTPVNSTREGASASGSPYTTPMRRPTSSRKTPNTSSRNVNPLARHLAMKAIRSVPSAQRGATHGALSSSGLTPTHTDRNGVALSLVADHQSMNADISEYDAANNSAIHNLDEIQKQFDIFADQLKHDASTAQADIVESERAWNELQYELHHVKTQLLDAETTRDFYHRQAEESEKNRLEWEQERQHLVDENNDLQNNVVLWHQRIGDAEDERQGIWKEGMQSREQLLHTIARLETELSESRADTSRIKVSLASATVEFDEKYSRILLERDELYDNVSEIIPHCQKLEDENEQMQADLYSARNELNYSRSVLSQREAALRQATEDSDKLARSLNDAKARARLVESRHNDAEAHIGQIEQRLDEMAHAATDAEKRVSDLQAEVTSLKEAKELLQETLENVTEQNRELKESHNESHLFKTAINETEGSDALKQKEAEDKPEAATSTGSADSEAIVRLKAEHRDTLEKMKNDYDLLVESLKSISESKNRYKADNAELTDMAEGARDEIKLLKNQLAQVKSSMSGTSRDVELEQLRESEERLKRELDSAERDRESISERIRILDERNKQLTLRNDELSQRTARLETELSDLQMQADRHNPRSDTADEDRVELELLHRTVDDLRDALSKKDSENDKLRQENASMDVALDDNRMELYKTQNKLSSEKDTLRSEMEKTKDLQQANDKLTSEISYLQEKFSLLGGKPPASQSPSIPDSSTANSPSMGQIDKLSARKFELSQRERELRAESNALEQSTQQMSDRFDKLKKEQRYLADQLRDTLLENKSLRNQFTEYLLRRAGKLRELQIFRNVESGNESFLNPDEMNISMMSGTVDMVPSTSQLLDNNNNGKFFKSLDKHLDMMGNIIDETDAQPQPPSGRLQKKMLTPIREEFGAQTPSYSTRDASVQCEGFLTVDIDRAMKQREDNLAAAREQLLYAEDDCRTLRVSVANVKQERDQFKVSQEEAAERVGQLTGQIEELSEENERIKAANMATARIALRVNRQLAVLKMALSRLEPRETRSVDSKKDDPQLSQIEADEREETLNMEEDNAMMQATIDHPPRKSDLALLGLVDVGIVDDGDVPVSPYLDGSDGYDMINNDEVLEQVGLTVSKTYAEVKRIRSGVIRLKRERARLMKRLAEEERSKLPSYELSTQWGRKLRSRSYAEDLVSDAVGAHGAAPNSGINADESAVVDEREESSEVFDANGALNLDMSVLRDPVAMAAKISRLVVEMKKRDRQLRVARKDRGSIEELNHELIQKLDRALAEKNRAQQECNAMTLRTQSRAAASRTTTPSRSTDWDDLDSIQNELQKSKNINKECFANVERLCYILTQHTLDRALADYDDAAQTPSGRSSQNASKSSQMENVYRTLLMDMALMLDAKSDLDEKKSIRENFNSMAAAVRKRLDVKDAELKSIRSKLEASRLASDAAANASMLSAKATSTTEERMRGAERRATELETQIAETHVQITTYQTNARSLNETISRLRQQCVAADSELQDTRLERDGWNQQCLANEKSLMFQIEENNQLKKKLDELAQLRSRDTRKFVEGGKLGYADQTTSIEREQLLREEWTEATREETKQVWLSEVFALRQTYEAQIKIYSWANMLWGDIISSFVSQAMRDTENSPGSGGADPNSALKTGGESLLQATNDLNEEIDMAVKRAISIQDNMRTPSGMSSYQDKSKRTRLVDDLNGIVHDLKRDFSGTWRESVREYIVTVAAGLVNATRHVQLVAGGGYPNITPTSANSGSSSSGQPQLTSEQKAKIRKHHDKKLAELQRQWNDRLQEERTKNSTREREIKSKHRKGMQMVLAEKQYYRERLNIMYDRYNFMKCQKKIMLKMAGGQEALLERVDKIAYQQRMREQSPSSSPEERRERIRSLWCRVLLAVRLCNGLYGMYIKGKEVNAIKEEVLNQVSGVPANSKAVQIKWSQPQPQLQPQLQLQTQQQRPQQEAPEPPRAWPELDHGSSNGNYVTAYHRSKVQRYAGLNTAPIKSSNLRNRSSDLRSSTGSSMN